MPANRFYEIFQIILPASPGSFILTREGADPLWFSPRFGSSDYTWNYSSPKRNGNMPRHK